MSPQPNLTRKKHQKTDTYRVAISLFLLKEIQYCKLLKIYSLDNAIGPSFCFDYN